MTISGNCSATGWVGGANNTDAWAFPGYGTYKGIKVFSAAGNNPGYEPNMYSVGLQVSGYYSMTLASYGGDNTFWIRSNDSAWKELIHAGNISSQTVANATNCLSIAQVSEEQNTDSAWGQRYAESHRQSLVYNTSGREWAYWIGMRSSDVAYGTILRLSHDGLVQFCNKTGGGAGQNWSGWKDIITSSNIGSQSVNYSTSSGSAGTSTSLNRSSGGFTTGGAGWFKIASIKTTDARGVFRISIYTNGGNWVPEYCELMVRNGWGIIDFIQYGQFSYISKYRYTVDSTYSYVEAYFTGNTTFYTLKFNGVGYVNDQNYEWSLYTSAVSGSGTVQGSEYTKSNTSAKIFTNGIIEGTSFVGSVGSADYANSAGSVSWSNVTSKSLGVFEYNNVWLAPSRLQLMRYDSTSYSDRACVGVTDGNLHIDCYANKGLYLNYYSGNITYIQGGSNYVTSSGYYTGSDRHLKKDIASIDKKELEDLFKVSESMFKEFRWKDNDTKSYGLIAQQVEKLIPEAISRNDKGMLSVNYEVAYAKILAMVIYKLKSICQ